jgi:RNA polymerase sigma factor (sigma-70 family)
VQDGSTLARFEATVLTHLDAAHNLARWLTQNDAAAEDAVQDACMRAFRFFDAMQGVSPKAWFMTIVRNTCMDYLREQKRVGSTVEFDEVQHTVDDVYKSASLDSPECAAIRKAEARDIHRAISKLPIDFREVIVLREFEEMSYKEISSVVNIPIGTVMSRIARGRDLLRDALGEARLKAAS